MGNEVKTASFIDTGHWKLIISISDKGMDGLLKNISQEDKNPILLFSNSWETPADGNFLDQIEATVYDNPRMLDDFATRIVIIADKALWVPGELAFEDEFDPLHFTSVYKADPEDIFCDSADDVACLYTLTPGLNSFLSRTLPGCRISSHINILKNRYGKDANQGVHIYLDLRQEKCDILLFIDGKFISAATHPFKAEEDLKYYLNLLANAYDFQLEEATLHICGEEKEAEQTGASLTSIVKTLDINPIPRHLSSAGIGNAVRILAEE